MNPAMDNDFEELVAARREAAERPLDGAAHRRLGNACVTVRLLPEAVDAFRKAIWISSDDALAHQDLAMAYDTQREWSLATEHHLEAVRLGADDIATHYELGRAAINDGECLSYTDAYDLISEIGRQVAEWHIRDGKRVR